MAKAVNTLKLGTRGSQLALFQANAVAARLRAHAGIDPEIVVIKTSGDKQAEAALSDIGGKRLFVKEIEDALLGGEIDLAVHSSKDMPAALPPGLAIGAVLAREDARDAVILPSAANASGMGMYDLVRHLGRGPRIGTSSVRRTAQLRSLMPDAVFLPVRGNLDTRLSKLDRGDFDALVLAAAGLRRLDHQQRISTALAPDVCVPAPGQGIIAVEIRSNDARLREMTAAINDSVTAAALSAERSVVIRLGGGCQMPIGAYAEVREDTLKLSAIVVALDGTRSARADAEGLVSQAERIGLDAAERLLATGAREILADVAKAQGAVEGLQP